MTKRIRPAFHLLLKGMHLLKNYYFLSFSAFVLLTNMQIKQVKINLRNIGSAILKTNTAIDPNQYIINVANPTINTTTRAG